MKKIKHITDIHKMEELSIDEKNTFAEVGQKFKFRTNTYYNSLIDWNDPDDPLRRIIIPDKDELISWGTLDASGERQYQPVEGLEHKYSSTALLLCNDVCGAYCRFCFRKRLFQDDNNEVRKDVTLGIEYIKTNTMINNVLLTGGDPLVLSNTRIIDILEKLKCIDHVKIIRVGTKMLGFDPVKISANNALLEYLTDFSNHKQIYFMLHFNHPRELTKEAIIAIKSVQNSGAVTLNQTPIIKGVNDNDKILSELFAGLSYLGVLPYYVFSCRPTEGNFTYAVPIEDAYDIFIKARAENSGLAKMARFVISYEKGKIEIIAKTDTKVYMKKHNWTNGCENEEIMTFQSNAKAFWYDDYIRI